MGLFGEQAFPYGSPVFGHARPKFDLLVPDFWIIRERTGVVGLGVHAHPPVPHVARPAAHPAFAFQMRAWATVILSPAWYRYVCWHVILLSAPAQSTSLAIT